MKTEVTGEHWRQLIDEQRQQAYFKQLEHKLEQARAGAAPVYPPVNKVFNAFNKTPFDRIKVVILGQDPYHQPGQAHGLAFSVPPDVKVPPSLRNIYKALEQDLEEFDSPSHGCLERWAEQGVLLLNTVLTVQDSKAHSHAKWGWETFTAKVMEKLNQHPQPLVFLLWGKHAQQKGEVINDPRHLVLHSVHPSPLSAHRGFFNCHHFSKANQFLQQQKRPPVDWTAINDSDKQERQQKLAL